MPIIMPDGTDNTLRDPAQYAGQPICPCCGSGWPCCTDRRSDGSRYSHSETCAQYKSASDVCGGCAEEFALEESDR